MDKLKNVNGLKVCGDFFVEKNILSHCLLNKFLDFSLLVF